MTKAYVKHDYAVTGRDYVETEGGGGGGGGVNYSTEEQDTGLKWLNGETIYQKTFTGAFSMTGTAWTSFADVTDEDILISASAQDESGQVYAISGGFADTKTKLAAYNPFSTRVFTAITLQYTKTE